MKILKISSMIVLLLLVLRFVTLLDIISFDFGIISELGRYVHGWFLGLIGLVINFVLYNKAHENRKWKTYSLVSVLFSVFVIFLELLLLYIFSRI